MPKIWMCAVIYALKNTHFWIIVTPCTMPEHGVSRDFTKFRIYASSTSLHIASANKRSFKIIVLLTPPSFLLSFFLRTPCFQAEAWRCPSLFYGIFIFFDRIKNRVVSCKGEEKGVFGTSIVKHAV